ncbi:NAD-dependent glycerol-3-phosphate dehydrogenase C-terminus [seawater metagenome]|uniref:NAD-dependent glycerol-3-phosphate dehydrogenase C-terminus n=1 Tax=seawater metagenome TaxID=1561972 RepID=A0A5E8CKI3_9ZZZZ
MNIGIFGTGHFALAIGYLINLNKHRITFIGRDASQLRELKEKKRNSKYHSYIFENGLETKSLENYISGFDILFYCLPSSCLQLIRYDKNIPIIFTCKGFSKDFIFNTFSNYGILSGGSYSSEIMNNIPCYMTISSNKDELCSLVSHVIKSKQCILSFNNQPSSIELLGIFKNILAIFCGIINELGMGKNIEAAFLSKIIKKLNKIIDFDEASFIEPAGIGDMFLSCSSTKSRNYSFGKNLMTKKTEPDSNTLVEGFISLRNMKQNLNNDFIIDLNIIIEKIINNYSSEDIKEEILKIIY